MLLMKSKKKGSVLVFSLIVLAIVLSATLSITVVNVSNRKSAASTAQSVQSFQVADTAAEKVLKAIYNGNYATPSALFTSLGSTCTSTGGNIALTLANVVSSGIGVATVKFLDTNGASLSNCGATDWRDTLTQIKVEGAVNSGSSTRVIEVGIAPLSSMAWGFNNHGQLGNGTTDDQYLPVSTVGGSKWKSVSAGGAHVLAVRSDGTLWAWGLNASGQLGDGTIIMRTSPVQIGTDTDWSMVSAGQNYSLALKVGGSLYAWGLNNKGQLGDNSTSERHVPTSIGNGYAFISAGRSHSLAVKTNGTLWAWGNGNQYRLGNNSTSDVSTPTQIGTDTDWQSVSAGENHSLAIKTNGKLYAWGAQDYGKLGNNTSSGNQTIPIQIGSATWLSVSAGGDHSLGVQDGHTLWAWGRDTNGQIGNGPPLLDVVSPVQIDGDPAWSSVSAGSAHSLALTLDGRIYAWGFNNHGQLGTNDTAIRNAYSSYTGSAIWQYISAGGDFSIGVRK